MSLSLILQEKERIFISADTATSFKVGNIIYRLDENGRKIYTFDNNKIIFISGNMDTVYSIIQKYTNMEHTIENIQRLLIEECSVDGIDDEWQIECIVVSFEGDRTVMYQISQYNNFEIIKRYGEENALGVYCAGIKTQECYDNAVKNIENKLPVQEIYKNTYDCVSFEGVGGYLNVYCLDKSGIHLILSSKIKEKDDIKRLSEIIQNKANFIIAGSLVGKAILGSKMTLSDENGQFDINGKNLTCKSGEPTVLCRISKINDRNIIHMGECIDE